MSASLLMVVGAVVVRARSGAPMPLGVCWLMAEVDGLAAQHTHFGVVATGLVAEGLLGVSVPRGAVIEMFAT